MIRAVALPCAAAPYTSFNEGVARTTQETSASGPVTLLGGDPDAVAMAVERAIRRRSPAARMLVTPSAGLLVGVRRVLPDRLWDAFVGTSFERPGA